jgi:hypothetical protein
LLVEQKAERRWNWNRLADMGCSVGTYHVKVICTQCGAVAYECPCDGVVKAETMGICRACLPLTKPEIAGDGGGDRQMATDSEFAKGQMYQAITEFFKTLTKVLELFGKKIAEEDVVGRRR